MHCSVSMPPIYSRHIKSLQPFLTCWVLGCFGFVDTDILQVERRLASVLACHCVSYTLSLSEVCECLRDDCVLFSGGEDDRLAGTQQSLKSLVTPKTGAVSAVSTAIFCLNPLMGVWYKMCIDWLRAAVRCVRLELFQWLCAHNKHSHAEVSRPCQTLSEAGVATGLWRDVCMLQNSGVGGVTSKLLSYFRLKHSEATEWTLSTHQCQIAIEIHRQGSCQRYTASLRSVCIRRQHKGSDCCSEPLC